MGIDARTTMDMDTCVKGLLLPDKELYNVLKEILSINIGDNIVFEINNSKPIREEDEYGGLKYNVIAVFDNLKVNLSIDIATGDLITPAEIEYSYKMIFENRSLKIMTYNIETIIAEKFQTVISRGILNSRMKDYYDLYYLITNKEFLIEDLKSAIINTFKKRNTNIDEIDKKMKEIQDSEFIKELWGNYTNKHEYAKNICIEKIFSKLRYIKEILEEWRK